LQEELNSNVKSNISFKSKTKIDGVITNEINQNSKSNISNKDRLYESIMQTESRDLYFVLNLLMEYLSNVDKDKFFFYPVSNIDAPGYSAIIKQPMAFSMMHSKIAQKVYKNLDDFDFDVKLMVNNCCTYNIDSSIYSKVQVF
jgi:bromodomain-containing protein 7/9